MVTEKHQFNVYTIETLGFFNLVIERFFHPPQMDIYVCIFLYEVVEK